MSEPPPGPTSAVLYSTAKHIARSCQKQNRQFYLCRSVSEDPHKCLAEGAAVTTCVLTLIKSLKGQCPKEFNDYTACMDWRNNDFEFCRKEQAAFEEKCPLPPDPDAPEENQPRR
mmetsp:Transcript_22656/g.77071  ORF Transcript_22656/g.77071 Transcript_22656/m.77071 type:complete len:115 (+) Transcript_22656:92-436(+)